MTFLDMQTFVQIQIIDFVCIPIACIKAVAYRIQPDDKEGLVRVQFIQQISIPIEYVNLVIFGYRLCRIVSQSFFSPIRSVDVFIISLY